MADLGSSGLSNKVVDAVDASTKFVANAAKAVGQSVVDDGKNLVGRDVALGTRIEAGVNIAADASSFVVGPEDVAAERAAVFAIKEGVEHAPQIVKGAEVAGEALVAKAPEIAKAVGADFERTKGLLEKAGHAIVDSHPEKGLLETKNALYKVIEQGGRHGEGIVGEVGAAGREAFEKGKNFAVHAERLPESLENGIKRLGQSGYHELKGLKATLSTSEMQVEKSIGEVEHLPLLERALGSLKKGQERFKGVSEGFDSVKKIAVGSAAVIGATAALDSEVSHIKDAEHKVVSGIEHAGSDALHSAVHHVEDAKHAIAHSASGIKHEVDRATSEATHAIGTATKELTDDVKAWTPEMSFEKFGALMNRIRGGVPSQNHDVSPHATSHDLGNQPINIPHRSQDLGHGH